MFDLKTMERESGLGEAEFAHLEREIRDEFPHDEMMFELHLARALEAFRTGMITKEQLLAQKTDSTEEIEPL